MRKVVAGQRRDRDAARTLGRLGSCTMYGTLTAAAAIVMTAGIATAQMPGGFGLSTLRIGSLQAQVASMAYVSNPPYSAGEETMQKRSGSAGSAHKRAIERYESAQASLSWGALGSGYSSADKLVVFIVVRYASRQAARAAAIRECARRQLTECEIPIIASDACFSIVRNDDHSWFQAGTDPDKLAAELLRQCREEGDGSTCYVSQLVCTDY